MIKASNLYFQSKVTKNKKVLAIHHQKPSLYSKYNAFTHSRQDLYKKKVFIRHKDIENDNMTTRITVSPCHSAVLANIIKLLLQVAKYTTLVYLKKRLALT